MLKKTLILFTVLTISHITTQGQCDYTINSYHWTFDGADIGNSPNITIHDPAAQTIVAGGGTLALTGGDVICMDASVSYKNLRFKNIIGDPGNPIIIKNIGGQVKIKSTAASYGWKFQKSKDFKILGNGDPDHRYGFKVTTHKNSFLQMIDRTTDFEIAYVEIAGDMVAHQAAVDAAITAGTPLPLEIGRDSLGFAGIMAKSQPVCVDDVPGKLSDRGNFEMKNVFIHDNYIHDVSGEGMYVGYGFARQNVLLNSWTNRYRDTNGDWVNVKCTETNVPHDISNLHIFNNIVERVGWDGIQVKNAYEDAYIYDNVIKNYATLAIGHHDEGLLVGDGSVATIYGNWIENGTAQSNGIQINATGNTRIYNNVVLGAGYTGLYLNNNNHLHLPGDIEMYNNTLEGGSGNAITSYSTQQTVKIKNNIGFGFGKNDPLNASWSTRDIKTSPNHIVSSNLTDKNPANIGFVNFANGNVRLHATSTAINTGINHTFDQYDFTVSPRDTSIDIGAFEYGAAINTADLSVAITTPSSNNITAPTTGSILILGSLIDTKNKVRKVQYILNGKLIGTDFMPNELKYNIGLQRIISGSNTFKIKATLYGGETFFSDPLTITK